MAVKLGMDALTIIQDSRESLPYDLSPMACEVAGLATGDYTVKGLEDYVCLERKSLPDLVASCTWGRDRFTEELRRMRNFPCKAVVIEADWGQLERGEYRSRANPQSVCHSIISWQARYGIPFHMAGSREGAERYALQFLYRAALAVCQRAAAFQQSISRESKTA